MINNYVIFVLYPWDKVDLSGSAIKSILTYLFMWTQLLNACICKTHK